MNSNSSPVPESNPDRIPDNEAATGPVNNTANSTATGGQGSGWGTPPSTASSGSVPVSGWGSPRASGGWGAPARSGSFAGNAQHGSSKQWTRKRGLVVAGAAAVLAGGAGVGVYALTTSTAKADTATDGQDLLGTAPGARGGAQGGFVDGGMPAQGGPGNFAPEGLGGMGTGVSAAVHSEYVILQDGAYVTKVEQQGTVTEVSSGAVTIKSTDGFSRTYSLDADVAVSNQQQRRQQAGGTSAGTLTVADIVSGAMVRIVAVKEGDSFPAESVQLVAATLNGQSN